MDLQRIEKLLGIAAAIAAIISACLMASQALRPPPEAQANIEPCQKNS